MTLRWSTLGGKLGLSFCLVGLALIWFGWNGAASSNDIRMQFPYLVSGGIGGLALVVIGAALMIIQSQRADRVQLEANLVELRNILERTTEAPISSGAEDVNGGFVVAGPSAYHQPSCRLIAGRDLKKMTPAQAQAAGLEGCRICAPTAAAEVDLANPGPVSGTPAR